jgi:hypothetical protein
MAKCDSSLLLQCQSHSGNSFLDHGSHKAKPKSHRHKAISLVALESSSVKDDLDRLQHPYTKWLMQQEFAELYRQTESEAKRAPLSLIAMDDEETQVPAVPKVQNATDDPPKKKAQRKCSIKDNPNCQHIATSSCRSFLVFRTRLIS